MKMNLSNMLEKRVYMIAEMSANHAGNINNAIEIIKRSKDAGADCIKIQTYTADTITIKCKKSDFQIKGGLWDGYTYYDLYSEATTPWEWQARLKEVCEEENIDFLSTPFDNSAVDFLESIGVGFYKVASYELVDIPLIEYIAEKNKPIIISCGMGNQEEIQEAIDACRRKNNNDIALLKCCSEYPAVLEHMNLGLINTMRGIYNLPIGLSDHSEGTEAAALAVAMGARIIEKHVCLDKSIRNPDSDFSMEMKEYANMVKRIRSVEKIIGTGLFDLSETEREGLKARRSLYAVNDIKKGDIITKENVRSIRPAYGLKPKYYNQILGKKATNNIEKGTPMKWELIEQLDGK